MFYVQKGAVQRIVGTEAERDSFLKQGYVEIDENGEAKIVESDADKLAALMAAGEQLKVENEALKQQLTELTTANKNLQKQVDKLTNAAGAAQ